MLPIGQSQVGNALHAVCKALHSWRSLWGFSLCSINARRPNFYQVSVLENGMTSIYRWRKITILGLFSITALPKQGLIIVSATASVGNQIQRSVLNRTTQHRYGTGSGSDRVFSKRLLRWRPVATAPGTVPPRVPMLRGSI